MRDEIEEVRQALRRARTWNRTTAARQEIADALSALRLIENRVGDWADDLGDDDRITVCHDAENGEDGEHHGRRAECMWCGDGELR